MPFKLTKTRHTAETRVHIGHNAAGGFWQHCHIEEGRTYPSPVGPQYATKAEIHADHEAYLRRGGWIRDDAPAQPDETEQLKTLIREAIGLMPLGTRSRADWVERALKTLTPQ